MYFILLILKKICFLAAAVLTSKVSAEGGSVGRRVLASRHNQSTIKSLEISQVC
jgi:hypothetical protein